MDRIFKHPIFLLLCIWSLVTLIFLLIYKINDEIYFDDYFSKVNYAENLSYKEVVDKNGEIEKRRGTSEFESLYYADGRNFVFRCNSDGDRFFARIEVTDSKYKFGKKIYLLEIVEK